MGRGQQEVLASEQVEYLNHRICKCSTSISPQSTQRARTDGQTHWPRAGAAEAARRLTGLSRTRARTRTGRPLPWNSFCPVRWADGARQADLGLGFWCQDRPEGHGRGVKTGGADLQLEVGPQVPGPQAKFLGLKGEISWGSAVAAVGLVGRRGQLAPSWLGSLGWHGFLQGLIGCPAHPAPT